MNQNNDNKVQIKNQYIPYIDNQDRNLTQNKEFQTFYTEQKQLEEQKNIQTMINTQNIQNYTEKIKQQIQENLKEKDKQYDKNFITRQTTITIDTRDLDKQQYPNPNFFTVNLGRPFINIRKIELIKVEFPNTNAVINSSNNSIYWRNLEDIQQNIIDGNTGDYPIYSAQIPTGTYDYLTLQSQLQTKMSQVKRRNKTGNFHNFTVNIDYNTDVVQFISLTFQYLENNPFQSTTNSGIVLITATNHGFKTGDLVYITGAQTFSGLPSNILNSTYQVTYIDNNTFSIEVNVNAVDTVQGGGNLVQIGKEAPFQLLFGDYNNTISQIIGYPLENSSQRIDTFIKKIYNNKIIKLTTSLPHKFQNNYDYIGHSIQFFNSQTNPPLDDQNIYYNNIIWVPDQNNIFIVQYDFSLSIPTIFQQTLESQLLANDTQIILPSTFSDKDEFYTDWYIKITSGLSTGQIRRISKYNGETRTATLDSYLPWISGNNPQSGDKFDMYQYPIQVQLVQNTNYTNIIPTFIFNQTTYLLDNISNNTGISYVTVNTQTNHNYQPEENNLQIDIFDTNSVPSFDGTKNIINVTGPNTFLLSGSVSTGGEATVGNISRHNPLSTQVIPIQSSTQGNFTIFEAQNNQLQAGDFIKLYNVQSVPDINLNGGIYQVQTVPDPNHFIIDFNSQEINLQESYFGFGLMTLSFPQHGFNSIIDIQNGNPGEILITTYLPHKFTNNDKIFISQTNSLPNIDGYYSISVVDQDTFSIILYSVSPSSGTLQSQIGASQNQVILPNTVGSTDYTSYFIKITSGNSNGITKFITNYSNLTFTATLDSNWTVQPQLGDEYILYQISNSNSYSGLLPIQIGLTNNQIRVPPPPLGQSIDIGGYIQFSQSGNTYIQQVVSFIFDSINSVYILNVQNDWDQNPVQGSSFVYYDSALTQSGTSGIIGKSHQFFIYGAQSLGGINSNLINGAYQTNIQQIRNIIDENTFTFMIPSAFSNSNAKGGGDNVFLSSLQNGFSGIQDNLKNDLITRSINLEGENYVFISTPQLNLNTIINTGNKVDNIFARVTLDTSPGYIVFSSVNNTISKPKVYVDSPLHRLENLDIRVQNYDGSFYNFNNLDWSMVIEITEELISGNNLNVSSRTGV